VTAGYANWSNIGENIAAGFVTPDSALTAFKNSEGHRAAMLSPSFREIGAGYFYDSPDAANVRQGSSCPYTASGGPYRYYWSQEFGARYKDGMPLLPMVINSEAVTTSQRQVSLYIYGGIYGQTVWAKQMRFSEDGVNWTAYEAWSPTKAFTLSPGNGDKTVYVQISNGSSTQTVSDSIYLDDPTYTTPILPARMFIPIVRK
jgi:hypothetical protein